jgi:uncharacterized protein (TIGR03083 family)
MARRVGAGQAGEAVLAQAGLIAAWLSGQPPSGWRTPSALPGWSVAELVQHLVVSQQNLVRTLARPSPDKPVTVDTYVAAYAEGAEQVRAREIEGARGQEPADLLAAYYGQLAEVEATLADPTPARAVAAPRGPITPGDFLLTRAIEMVVHADDLSRSQPDRDPVELDRGALRLVTQSCADIVAARAPGRSLELRVPPYAAVQCVEGPRHTRGTPPNVVETDPLTWIRLAAGRLAWNDAVTSGSVRASGERADLGRWLPLF